MTRKHLVPIVAIALWVIGLSVLAYRKSGASAEAPDSPKTSSSLGGDFTPQIAPVQAAAPEPEPSDAWISPGDLLKVEWRPKVCFVTAKRTLLAFADDAAFASWYPEGGNVRHVRYETVAGKYPVVGVITVRPGSNPVKIEGDEKIYAVARGAVLRWIQDPAIAHVLYGPQWIERTVMIPKASLRWYRIGGPISDPAQYDPAAERRAATTIEGAFSIVPESPPEPVVEKPDLLAAENTVVLQEPVATRYARLVNPRPFTSACAAKNGVAKKLRWRYGDECLLFRTSVRTERRATIIGVDVRGVLVRYRRTVYPIRCMEQTLDECPVGGLAFMERASVEKAVEAGRAEAERVREEMRSVEDLLKRHAARKH